MSGVAGRSGRVSLATVMRKCQVKLEKRRDEIMDAYIEEGLKGNATILCNMVDRLAGESKKQIDVTVRGEVSGDEVAMIYKAAYEQFQEQKQLPEHSSSDKQE